MEDTKVLTHWTRRKFLIRQQRFSVKVYIHPYLYFLCPENLSGLRVSNAVNTGIVKISA
jgi:hypothetical protein